MSNNVSTYMNVLTRVLACALILLCGCVTTSPYRECVVVNGECRYIGQVIDGFTIESIKRRDDHYLLFGFDDRSHRAIAWPK